jgi:hypothetical protein
MTTQNFKSYLLVWLISAILSIGFVGLFNYIVDPYGFYRSVEITGFNQQKEGVRSKIRYVKALELPLRKPRTIIMGSSRVHDGMNPQHILLRDPAYAPAYNLGIDMDRIHESLQYLKHAIVHSEIKQVILGLDLFMFNASQKTNSNFDSGLVGRKIGIGDYLSTSIFSRDAFADSIRTIKTSYSQPERAEFLSNGFRPGNLVFYRVKKYQALHYYTNYIFLSSLPSQTKYYADMTLDQEVFDDFEEILKICKQNNINIKLYISPAHANLDGEGIAAAGKWELMEAWKRKMVTIADRYATPVWDFSGYNSITTELVRTPMKYYWDSSHFTEVVSDLILKRMLAPVESIKDVPADFGIRISGNNIEQHLARIRESRQKYIAENTPDMFTLNQSYRSFLNGGAMDPKKIEGMY